MTRKHGDARKRGERNLKNNVEKLKVKAVFLFVEPDQNLVIRFQ